MFCLCGVAMSLVWCRLAPEPLNGFNRGSCKGLVTRSRLRHVFLTVSTHIYVINIVYGEFVTLQPDILRAPCLSL